MKLIISATGPNPTDAVDPRFGRAPYLIQYDVDTEAFVTLDNAEQVEASQGAGVQTAQDAVAGGADAVLTGHCGPKAFQVLTAAGVTIYSGCEGTVADAVRAWRNNELEPLAAPDGQSRH